MKLRKILALVLALVLLCATISACGGSDGGSTASGAGSSTADTGDTGTSGGSMNNYINMEPTSLNTLLASYAADFNVLNSLYETLLELDGNDVAQPAAAETYEVSEDNLTYTFHLREDGVWSNGDPVTAQDFVYAWQLALNPEVAAD